MGVTPGYYIPSRYIDGYGINKTRVDQFIAKGYEVIITVDNGISEVETIDYAKSKGLEVIVIDHHEVTKMFYQTLILYFTNIYVIFLITTFQLLF